MEGKGNRLGGEKSPYLRQHAHNPVWWHAWGAMPSMRPAGRIDPFSSVSAILHATGVM